MNITESRVKTSVSLLPKTIIDNILEIGFDQYSFSDLIGAKRYIGIDIRITSSPVNMIPICGNALAIPFKKHSFELVIITEVIEHIEDAEAALYEINRVLTPGGLMLLSTPNADSIDFRIGRFFGINVENFYMSSEHVHEYRWGELSDLIRMSGFEILKRRGVAVKIPRMGYLYSLQRILPGLCEYTIILSKKIKDIKSSKIN